MTDLTDLPAYAFDKDDPAPDRLFYAQPRFVAHIDERAIAAVTDLYRRTLPRDGVILDLMSSWISHLPSEVSYRDVVGLGMNTAELAANARLTRRVVQDLNADPVLPLEDASVDGAAICVSVQYLQQPVPVLREVARVLRPGAPLVIAISDRCFPTKAVAVWTALDAAGRLRLATLYLAHAGFDRITADRIFARDAGGDPLWAVVGRRPD